VAGYVGPQALTNAELLAILLRDGVKGKNAVEVGQCLLMVKMTVSR